MSAIIMSNDEVHITLENLLCLALGNPEVGAVNFNLLHEVIAEILKHLGISKKLARITQEIDYRISRSTKKKLSSRFKSVESIPEVPQQTSITTPQLLEEEAHVKEEPPKLTDPSSDSSSDDVVSKVSSAELKKESSKSSTKVSSKELKKEFSKELKKESSKELKKESSKELKKESSKELKKKSSKELKKESSKELKKESSKDLKRKSSIISKGSVKEVMNTDAAIISRTMMDRRESKTPAGDMWHVLNINRRVEAAEAAIQGMTNLIDNINSELEDVKNATENSTSRTVAPTKKKSSNDAMVSKQEQEVIKKMAAKLRAHDGKISEMEKQISASATQDQIQDYCTPEKVNNLIMERLGNLQAMDIDSGMERTDTETDNKEEVTTPEEPAQKEISPEPSKKDIPQKSSQRIDINRENTRSRLWHIEVLAKIGNLESEMKKTKENMKKVEVDLTTKYQTFAESLAHVKINDQTTVVQTQVVGPSEDEINKLYGNIENVNKQLQSIDNAQNNHTEEMKKLKIQSDSADDQQKSLTSAMNKLERDIEHIADNFHRTQSDVMRTQPQRKQSMDEIQANKIRGTIFDLQEQQSRLQHQIDVLQQDGINKTQKFKDVYGNLKELHKTKIDEEFVLKRLEGVVGQDAIEGKLDRDQFDMCISEIDRHLQDIMQKMAGAENTSTGALTALHECLTEKADSDEIKQVRIYIDNRFKNFKPKISVMKEQNDLTAAATRKQLLPECNCISCDRPVEIPSTAGIALPGYQPLPGMKTLRPMTTFDLQTIRQQMQSTVTNGNKTRFEMANTRDKLQKELLQLCGVRDLNELAIQTNRACGGVHTLVEQHRRNPVKPPMLYREEQQHTIFQNGGPDGQLFETDVLGRDGHIYKGRMKSPNALPMINDKPRQGRSDNHPIIPRPSMQKSGSGMLNEPLMQQAN